MEKRIWKFTVCIVSLALVLSILGLPAFAAEKGKKAAPMTITGTVVEMGKTAKGQATYGVKTDKGDYLLSGKKGAELGKLVGKKVEATGAVQASKGKNYITVSSYKVMEAQAPAPAAAPAAQAPAPAPAAPVAPAPATEQKK